MEKIIVGFMMAFMMLMFYVGMRERRDSLIFGAIAIGILFAFIVKTVEETRHQTEATTTPKTTGIVQPPANTNNPNNGLVYVYGQDKPITLAEHERQLAYSAAHSPGDDE